METIAQRLKRLRKDKNLSVKEVAKRSGIPTTTYREWEYGRSIKGEPYAKLAELFDISLSELITGKVPAKGKVLTKVLTLRSQIEELEKDLRSFL